MLPTRQFAALLLLLAGSCSSGPAPIDALGPRVDPVGHHDTYEGACDRGKGRLDLFADGAFSLYLQFGSNDGEWDIRGQWRDPSQHAAPDAGMELVVQEWRIRVSTERGKCWVTVDAPTDESGWRAIADGKQATVLGFILPRAR